MPIKPSELIINPDGSVYHLNLKPEHIAKDIFFVGDQDRVELITKHFDSIEFSIQKREFKTQTGTYKGKRLTVMSTGIGPDNIDIVMNELDALANIDLETREIKSELTSLNIVRIGTSGSLQPDIPVDSFVLSTHGLDLNGNLHYYELKDICLTNVEDAFIEHTSWDSKKARPLIIANSKTLEAKFESDQTFKGVTATAGGFYGPQGRVLRLAVKDSKLNTKIDSFRYEEFRVTNLEMETSVIFGLSKLLGHHALALNAIVANRANRTFSEHPRQTVERLITYALERV
ncbi:MAG: phosphorylase [Bacteroidetes bacterium MedPE-SWsnd-G2]|nr:MAG: phosphorylase [Bacteroidetes bacterium MedPE-SWsnd-G2]